MVIKLTRLNYPTILSRALFNEKCYGYLVMRRFHLCRNFHPSSDCITKSRAENLTIFTIFSIFTKFHTYNTILGKPLQGGTF